MLWFKKREYIDWQDYSRLVEFTSIFNWQQSVRKNNIR